MKKYHNMTNETDFEGNEAFFKENNSTYLSWSDVFWVVLFFFFAIGFFVRSNELSKMENEKMKLEEKVNYYEKQLKIYGTKSLK